MAKSFLELKNARSDNFKKLIDKVNQLKSPQYDDNDDRMWKPTRDKDDNGYAVVRFLPAPSTEETPFVMIWDHGFQASGGWFVNKCLTTVGKQCPVCDHNTMLWNRNQPGDRPFVQGIGGKNGSKRRLQYRANIMVVEDPAHPENNGKVFLYEFGKKIFDKLEEAMNPKYPDEAPLDPFDLWNGAHFKIKIQKEDGWVNYNRSEFAKPSPAIKKADGSADDAALEAVWNKTYSLQEFVDPAKFKSYDDQKKRLYKVLGLEVDEETEAEAEISNAVAPPPAAPTLPAAAPKSEDPPWDTETSSDSGDDELAEFQKLVGG